MSKKDEPNISRRKILKGAAVLPLTVAVAALAKSGKVFAGSKASKAAMQYQDKPKNGVDCSTCMHFNAASSTCNVVEGTISPKGWCVAYAKKS